jgi:hypothetical protein
MPHFSPMPFTFSSIALSVILYGHITTLSICCSQHGTSMQFGAIRMMYYTFIKQQTESYPVMLTITQNVPATDIKLCSPIFHIPPPSGMLPFLYTLAKKRKTLDINVARGECSHGLVKTCHTKTLDINVARGECSHGLVKTCHTAALLSPRQMHFAVCDENYVSKFGAGRLNPV